LIHGSDFYWRTGFAPSSINLTGTLIQIGAMSISVARMETARYSGSLRRCPVARALTSSRSGPSRWLFTRKCIRRKEGKEAKSSTFHFCIWTMASCRPRAEIRSFQHHKKTFSSFFARSRLLSPKFSSKEKFCSSEHNAEWSVKRGLFPSLSSFAHSPIKKNTSDKNSPFPVRQGKKFPEVLN